MSLFRFGAMKTTVVALALLGVAVMISAEFAPQETEAAHALSSGGAAAAGAKTRAPRTFGGPRKRLLMLLPIVYKLGVITTLLGVLIALAVKSVAIGLLVLALGAANLAVVTKLKSSAHHGWSSGYAGGVPVHLHVHSGGHGGHGGHGASHPQAYAAWDPASAPHPPYVEHYDGHPYRRRR